MRTRVQIPHADDRLGYRRTKLAVTDPPAGFPRYQYAGGRGYEAVLLRLGGAPTSPLPPIRLIHVADLWYDTAVGRLVLRSPESVLEPLNAYLIDHPWLGAGGTTVERGIAQAIARGDVAEVQTILESAGEILKPAAKKAAEQRVRKARTKAVDWARENVAGSIWREFPGGEKGQWAQKTLEEIWKATRTSADAKKRWKLLNEPRFAK